jgi:hypothetical protein
MTSVMQKDHIFSMKEPKAGILRLMQLIGSAALNDPELCITVERQKAKDACEIAI